MTAHRRTPKMGIMKRFAFLIGIGLLALALLSSGAELAARAIQMGEHAPGTLFMPLGEVWAKVAPGSFAALQADDNWPILSRVLTLPGWLLFGAPGMALVILFRKRDDSSLSAQQARDHEESLYLYDELVAAAQKEGLGNLPHDLAPSDPADTVPAEEHYATDPIYGLNDSPNRDFLLDVAKPNTPEKKDGES